MKKYLTILFVTVFGLGLFGCTPEQRKSLDDTIKVIREYVEAGKENTAEFIETADNAIEKITELVTAAEKDTPPAVPGEADPIVETISTGAKAAAPLLPPPYNIILGAIGTLLPFGAAWLKAKSRADKRTAEEALLIAGLQTLKQENPEAFKQFIEYRDLAARGLLTAKQTAELLEGINKIRATYS